MVRVTYMGTPEYAVPTLERLAATPDVEIGLVVTQPDRPQGRGHALHSPPVKLAADRLDLPVLQASTLKDTSARSTLEASSPDLIVVAAFGLILGPKTLGLPPLGCVNLHASLLPAYRGANPIAAAIADGAARTGVTLMYMDRGLDTGDIIASESTTIEPTETTTTLTSRLADLGASLLIEMLPGITDGSAPRQTQPAGATITRPMLKNDGWIDWSTSAAGIDAHIRAMTPWPGSWTTLPDGIRLIVHDVTVADDGPGGDPGTLVIHGESIWVGTGAQSLRLDAAQLPGGKVLMGSHLAQRLRNYAGHKMGLDGAPDPRPPLVIPID